MKDKSRHSIDIQSSMTPQKIPTKDGGWASFEEVKEEKTGRVDELKAVNYRWLDWHWHNRSRVDRALISFFLELNIENVESSMTG